MTQTVIEDPAELAAALRLGAAGLYCAEAGVELLIATGCWLHRPDFTGPFVTGFSGSPVLAFVDWPAAVQALAGGMLPCSGGQRRMLHLAASLAADIPAGLAGNLNGLDRANACAVATAVLHAAGHRPHTVVVQITSPDTPPHLVKGDTS
jgi:hypothetical protein